ncbi:leucine-rich repeat domain-containing protein [Bacteroidota bacterium]
MKNNIKNKFSDFRLEKGLLYIVIFLMLFSSGTLLAQNLEQGVKYLKLGNTYMTCGDYDEAIKFLNKGHDIVRNKSKYWTAVAYEYLGFYYHLSDNDRSKALSYLNRAKAIYEDIISIPDGSQEALNCCMDNLDQVKSFPPSSSVNVSGSEVMNYDNQKLRELPDDIPLNINNLSLADNKFRDFPAGLFDFKNLQFLNLANNKLKELPEDISSLQNLLYLNLSGNKLKNLPAGLSGMKNLRMLDLKGNKIEFEDISNLLRKLPNTNILFDKYVPESEEQGGFGFEGEPEEGF